MSEAMHIGLITGEYPPDQGGVGDFTNRLAHALADLGHRTHVITSAGPVSDPNLDAAQSASRPVGVHRIVENWGFGCWGTILELSQDLNLEVLNMQ